MAEVKLGQPPVQQGVLEAADKAHGVNLEINKAKQAHQIPAAAVVVEMAKRVAQATTLSLAAQAS